MRNVKKEKAPTAGTVRALELRQQHLGKADMSNNSTNTQVVNFHGAELLTVLYKNEPHVAMKPVCESIGLDWRGQRQRILRDEVLSEGVCIITTPSFGGNQDTLCLRLDLLNGWLFGIDIGRCREEIRSTLIKYKRECFKALHDYWTKKGEATNPRFSNKADRTPLKNAINMLIDKSTNLSYSDAWQMVHQRFAIGSVKELTVDQLPAAVEYVHKIILEGKLVDEEPKPIAVIDPLSIEKLPPGRYLVYPEGDHFGIKRLGQVAIVPMEHVEAIRRDMNQFMQYGAELMSRMRILHGETNLERLAEPLIR